MSAMNHQHLTNQEYRSWIQKELSELCLSLYLLAQKQEIAYQTRLQSEREEREKQPSSPLAAARVGLRAEVPASLGTSALYGCSTASGPHPQTETVSPSQRFSWSASLCLTQSSFSSSHHKASLFLAIQSTSSTAEIKWNGQTWKDSNNSCSRLSVGRNK